MACKYLHIVNSIVADTTASTLTLNFTSSVTANNEDKFCFKIPCSVVIPSGSNAYTVNVTVNGSAVPLWDKYGNVSTGSDLVKKKLIQGYFGNTSTNHVIAKTIPVTYNCGCSSIL